MQTIIQFIDECNANNSTSYKEGVLRKYANNEDVRKALYYAYNPYYIYGVSSASLKKNKQKTSNTMYLSIWDLLDALRTKVHTGNAAIEQCNAFTNGNADNERVLHYILDRNLQIRIGETIINKIIPKHIPIFEVPLAKEYNKQQISDYFASRKLDGIRCVHIIDGNGEITARTRNGKPITTTQQIIDLLMPLNLKNVVFDGELCIVDENGNEDFNAIQSEWNKKNHTIKNPGYRLIDCIPLSVFNGTAKGEIFSVRREKLKNYIAEKFPNSNIIKVVDQIKVRSHDEVMELMDMAIELKWEGLILRKDTYYKSGRSNDLLKVKAWKDAEFIIQNLYMGPMRIIDSITGLEKTEEMLSSVDILYKNCVVNVGSGFSQEQRRYFYQHPNELIGKTITVKYFSESIDKNGKYSLRFPTVKYLYKNGREE